MDVVIEADRNEVKIEPRDKVAEGDLCQNVIEADRNEVKIEPRDKVAEGDLWQNVIEADRNEVKIEPRDKVAEGDLRQNVIEADRNEVQIEPRDKVAEGDLWQNVIVVAGALFENGRVLVTQRKAGAHLEGLWELPGGKIDPDEDPRDALVRELREELGVEVTVGAPIEVTSFRYPSKRVLLLFFECTRTSSSPEPRALDVADLQWADRATLGKLEFPPADVAVIAAIARRLS